MSMQLKNLVTLFSEMSDEDALEKIRKIRKNRNEVRPATQARVKKGAKKKATKIIDVLKTMSDEDRLTLIASLENNNG